MADRIYELRKDWLADPLFKGTAREVAHEARRLAQLDIKRGSGWGFVVQETSHGSAKVMPYEGWMGTVAGSKSADGSLSGVEVSHVSHNGEWERDALDAHNERVSLFRRKPLPVKDLMKLTASARNAEWETRGAEAMEIEHTARKALVRRDALATDVMLDIADGFADIGEEATTETMDTPNEEYDRDTPPWYRTPEQYEDDFRSLVKEENQSRLALHHKKTPGREWYKGYVERPDGSFGIGRVNKREIWEMYVASDFSPPKRGSRDRVQGDFPKRKGI